MTSATTVGVIASTSHDNGTTRSPSHVANAETFPAGARIALGILVPIVLLFSAAAVYYVVKRRRSGVGRYSNLSEFGADEELNTPAYGYNQGDQGL
jgi:hypothetical protein